MEISREVAAKLCQLPANYRGGTSADGADQTGKGREANDTQVGGR